MPSRPSVLTVLAASFAGLLSVVPARATAQRRVRDLAPVRVGAQIGAGILTMPVGFVLAGKATEWAAERSGSSDERASRVALTGAWVGAGLATAASPALIGARGPGAGTYAAALGGAAVGGAASFLLVRLNDRTGDGPRRPCRIVCAVAAAAVFALPSIGGTVAYDASRRSVR